MLVNDIGSYYCILCCCRQVTEHGIQAIQLYCFYSKIIWGFLGFLVSNLGLQQ